MKFLTWRGRSRENAKKERRLLLPGRNFKRGGVERRKPFSKGGREISDLLRRDEEEIGLLVLGEISKERGKLFFKRGT